MDLLAWKDNRIGSKNMPPIEYTWDAANAFAWAADSTPFKEEIVAG